MKIPPPDFRQLRFWSDEYPPDRRLAAWQEVVSRMLLKVELEPLSNETFQVDATLRLLPTIRFGSALFGPCISRRTSAIAQADNDDVYVVINTEGTMRIQIGATEHTLGEGDACLLCASQVVTLTRPAVGRLTLARMERGPLTRLVSGLDDYVGQVFRDGNEALRLLTIYLRDIDHRQGLTSTDVRGLVIAHIYDILALVLNSSRGEERCSEGASAERLRRIKKYITDNLGAADLSITEVAAENRISARQVQRLFELEGRTFSEFVLAKRLQGVRAALVDVRQTHRSVSDIALANGFGDVSYFNRAFRRQYGASPSEVRRSATAAV